MIHLHTNHVKCTKTAESSQSERSDQSQVGIIPGFKFNILNVLSE